MIFHTTDSDSHVHGLRRSIRHCAFLGVLAFLVMVSCAKLEDADPAPRNTFLHFYGGIGNFRAVAAQETSDGYIIVGDSLPAGDFGIVVVKTDKFGSQVWRKNFPHGSSSSIMVDGTDGYFIIGDSIKVNPRATQVSDIVIRKSRLIRLDAGGTKTFDRSYGDTSSLDNRRVDYSGSAFVKEGDLLINVNSMKSGNQNTSSVVAALNTTSNFDTAWTSSFNFINRDYVNSKSAHVSQAGEVIWAITATAPAQLSTRAYIQLTVASPGSQPKNAGAFGYLDDLYYSGNDIQRSGAGYGIIGTFQTITGGSKNICFVQSDIGGYIVDGSERYFDAVPSDPSDPNSITTTKTVSATDDEGSALTATGDGGFLLAGSSLTSTSRGNGKKDIFLIRLDPFGKVLWNRIIGGSGDETVSTVTRTSDGGFLISGTLDLNDLQSMFILKVDNNGNLQN